MLKELLKDSTAGDPMGGLRWTHKTTRNLAAALNRRGVAITHVTVGRLLHEMKYSLRTNRKRLAKTNDPDREKQFRLLARRRRRFQRDKCPVISVDCKKKELLGNFKNSGCTWPLQQVALGISPQDLTCKDDFLKLYKSNGNPICGAESTAVKLIARGFTK